MAEKTFEEVVKKLPKASREVILQYHLREQRKLIKVITTLVGDLVVSGCKLDKWTLFINIMAIVAWITNFSFIQFPGARFISAFTIGVVGGNAIARILIHIRTVIRERKKHGL